MSVEDRRPVVPVGCVQTGTRLRADNGFTCLRSGAERVVTERSGRLAVRCCEGWHFLDGQATATGQYVGFRYPYAAFLLHLAEDGSPLGWRTDQAAAERAAPGMARRRSGAAVEVWWCDPARVPKVLLGSTRGGPLVRPAAEAELCP